MVTLTDIYKSFGPDVVFSGLNQRFYANEKVGLTGVNGSGKTTLLKLMLGEIEPDAGKIVQRKGLRIGYLPQEPVFDSEKTVFDEMHTGLEKLLLLQRKTLAAAERLAGLSGRELKAAMQEYERLSRRFELAGGYGYETQIRVILTGLGVGEELYDAKTRTLSGGQLSRLGIAKALLAEADLLLLDEPTNHLDLEATVWLEKFLRSYAGAVVLISHDRYLLDAVTCKMVEVHDHKSFTWKGNYSRHLAEKQKAELASLRQHKQRLNEVEKTRDFIARNKDREGMRKTARGRKRRLDRLLKKEIGYLDKPPKEKVIGFRFKEEIKRSDVVLRAEGLCKSFGPLVLFEDLSFDVLSGQRLGITGPNGTGKSTLIKMALGHMEPTAGSIRMGPNLSVGYLDQHGQELNPDRTVLQEAQTVRADLCEEAIRTYLGAFLFRGEDVLKNVSQLSGGQQSRLALCRIVLTGPDVLVLDEPTNHLDINSREVLECALKDYKGTIIFVSHDRFFLDRVAGRLLVIGSDDCGYRDVGQFNFFSADRNVYSYYADTAERYAAKALNSRRLSAKGHVSSKRAEDKKLKAKKATPAELRPFNKLSTRDVEQMIIKLEEELGIIEEGFGRAAIYQNPSLLAEHRVRFEKKRQELSLLCRVYELRDS